VSDHGPSGLDLRLTASNVACATSETVPRAFASCFEPKTLQCVPGYTARSSGAFLKLTANLIDIDLVTGTDEA
jgi:hypothetical protein